ncbi:glucose-6-phosphatase 3-like [Oratosquilla oratoria]|uniref:glucose-6-phosphatase 3-like n=1 Tax=Oratosquilla oratoria TaxID=337810 RepID=UPI003F7604C3
MALTQYVDGVHKWGIDVIALLQERFPGRGPLMMQISDIGDPGYAFSIYVPVVSALHPGVGVRLLWSIIFCEWSNMILKWLLTGDRPYWWVHESPIYLNKTPPFLHQFPRTCETGPGMPSGHTKVNAAMFFVIVSALCTLVIRKSTVLSKAQRLWTERIMWIGYVIWLVMVITSRVYIAAHFPHQCIAGAIVGISISLIVARMPGLLLLSRLQYILISASILISVFTVFGLYQAVGNNPMWALELALKWCISKDYIHLDSTPFYSLMRYSGNSLGLGLALTSSFYSSTNHSRFSTKMVLSLAIFNILVGQFGTMAHKSLPPTMTGWYFAEFVLNTIIPYLLVAFMPYFVMRASGVSGADKYKKP